MSTSKQKAMNSNPALRYKVVFYNPESGEETTRFVSARSENEARKKASILSDGISYELYVRMLNPNYGNSYYWEYLGK